MLRNSLFVLLLFPLLSQAAITFVDENTSTAGATTARTVTEPTGAAENDLIVCFASISIEDGVWTDPADFTELDNNAWGTGSDDHTYLGYKVRGATAGNTLTFSYSGTADTVRATCLALRGIDTGTPIDTTYVTGSHYNENLDDSGVTAAQPVITTTNGAWVMLFQFIGADGSFTQGVPSGYTARADHQGLDAVHQIVNKEVATATTETPGAWTHTSVTSVADTANYTLAIRPAAASSSALLRRRR